MNIYITAFRCIKYFQFIRDNFTIFCLISVEPATFPDEGKFVFTISSFR